MAQTMNLSKRTCLTNRRREVASSARPVSRVHASKATVAPLAAPAPSHQTFVSSSSSKAPVTRVEAAGAPAATEKKQWYALVANTEFFLNDVQNESIAEQLRERVRFFKEQNRDIDFWLVPDPTWLDAKYPNEAKMVKRPCMALVSTDEMWITFMKLRLDRVLRINLGAVEQSEALAVGGKVPEFKKPEKWTAPYAPYSSGWWNVFLPNQQ